MSITDTSLVEYKAGGNKVKLTPAIVKKFLVNGTGNVTEKEIVEFMQLCRFQGLNPFLREAYLIKYGNQDATIVTGKDFFLRRARSASDLAGFRAGVIVGSDGEIEKTDGYVPDGKKVLAGWAEVKVRGWDDPVRVEVPFNEYVGRKKDGSINSMWKQKPSTMIRKVALVQALREAFPGLYSGLYSPEEINTVDTNTLNETPIDVEPEEETGETGENGQPKFRSRRNVQQVGDMEIKTCGVTGEALMDIKRMRQEHPEAVRPLIHEALDRLEIQDITFLREDEGEELVRQIVKAISQAAQEPPGTERPSDTGDSMPTEQKGPPEPPDVDWSDNAAPREPKAGELNCPVRGQGVSPKICANRCEKRDKCQTYKEFLYEEGGE